jgi:hypothetical protein
MRWEWEEAHASGTVETAALFIFADAVTGKTKGLLPECLMRLFETVIL